MKRQKFLKDWNDASSTLKRLSLPSRVPSSKLQLALLPTMLLLNQSSFLVIECIFSLPSFFPLALGSRSCRGTTPGCVVRDGKEHRWRGRWWYGAITCKNTVGGGVEDTYVFIHKLVKKNVKGSSSFCVPPMQPVLSCFYGGAIKSNRRSALEIVGKKDIFDPELVAEPSTTRSKSFVGTHEYLAPEVISGAGHSSTVDWWTLGVFLYEMMYGRTPFKGEDNEKTLINIIKQPLTFPKVATCGKELDEILRAQDLISKLLTKNPRRSIGSLKGAVEIKRHDI